MSAEKWIVKTRNYELDTVKYEVKPKPILKDQDPLIVDISTISVGKTQKAIQKPVVSTTSTTAKKKNPISSFFPLAAKPTADPLAAIPAKPNVSADNKPASNQPNSNPVVPIPKNVKINEDFKRLQYSLIVNKDFNIDDSILVNWTSLKKNLMDLFCNNYNMEVKSLIEIDFDDEMQKTYKIEKGRTRIEELNDEKGFNVVTSGQFVSKMEIVKREMLQKWEKEDKIGTLKIIIQCTKILNDVFTPKFYCHKFLLISDILDNFARLVYERILKLSFGTKNHVDFSNINPTVGSQTAKDVCTNWIYKCCCIRELLPRIYIDISFLGIFKFIMNDRDLELKILTIANMIAGISHPLIAFYVSMYLTKIVLTLFPRSKHFLFILLRNISKFSLDEGLIRRLNYESNISIEELKKILDPCVEWICYCACKNMMSKDFKNLMLVYDQSKDHSILKGIIIHSPVKYLFSEEYLKYLFACFDIYNKDESAFLCLLVCQKILISDNPIDSEYISIIWAKIKNAKNKCLFIDCSGLLGEILIKFHNEDIQDKFFEEVFDIFKSTFSMSNNTEDQNYFAKFEIFLYTILTKITNYTSILSGDNFLFLLENFTPEIKLNICNTIIKQIIHQNEKIRDPFLAFSLLKIGKYIHDTIEVFTAEPRKKDISDILIKFIYQIDFGIDYENYLNFLTEARGFFSYLDDVTEILIKQVQKIAIQTYKIVKGKHNKKTMRFCKVCVAYCQITIPGITQPYNQLKLQLTTAQIALMNNLISECDNICKNMITGISKIVNGDFNKIDADFILNFSKSLLGFFVLVPSNPDAPFQLISGLINIFSSETLNKTFLIRKTMITMYISIVKFLTTQLQNKLPYHIFNVDSNDEIFTCDELFKREANALIDSVITSILNEISEYDSKLTPYDYDEFEFMITTCGNCIELFKYNFEETKFEMNVINKMLELIEKYTDFLEKTNSFGIKQKVEKYKKYFQSIVKS